MAPRKQPKGPSAAKALSRRASAKNTDKDAALGADPAGGLGQAPLPFPYEVRKGTLKDTITRYLETEVAKHHVTTLQLEEALRQVEALKGGGEKDVSQPGAPGDEEEDGVEPQDDDEDIDMHDEDDWAGIAGDNHSEVDSGNIANKVQSLEAAMTQMARGLHAVTTAVNRGFHQLSATNNNGNAGGAGAVPLSSGTTQGPLGAYEGVYDLDTDSFAVIGGKSDWDDLMARFDTAGEKDMQQIARGDIMPEKIYLCIPRDSDLFPEVTEETKDKVRWDEEGPYLEKKDSAPYNKTKVFKNLAKAVTSPMHFQHAWGWFMVLVNYHYKDAALMSEMMQFGAEVVQFDGIYKWGDCLKVHVNLARPILRGNLDQRVKMFKEANFALALSKCAPAERLRGPLVVPTAVGTTGAVLRPTQAPVYIDGVEVCRRFNKGLCEGHCPHGRRHACLRCRSPLHKAFQCNVAGGVESSASGPSSAAPSRAVQGFQSRPFVANNVTSFNRQAGGDN